MSGAASIVGDAACPRCGYDLRGHAATWVESCPLDGTCAECGLAFEWSELLSLTRSVPRWCVEHDRRGLLRPRRIAATLAHTHWPWGFWSAVRMSHDSRWLRLFAYLSVWVVALYLVLAVTHGWMAWSIWKQGIAMPTMAPTTSGSQVFLQAMLLPLSDESIGGYRAGPGPVYLYAPPVQHAHATWYQVWPFAVVILTQHALCGLTFALLPVSRRKAKVQWRHILRVTLYGYGLLVVPFALAIAAIAAVEVQPVSAWYSVLMVTTAAAWIALPVMEVVWWSVATGRFLRMKHAWGVGLAVVVIGVLAAPALLAVFWVVL